MRCVQTGERGVILAATRNTSSNRELAYLRSLKRARNQSTTSCDGGKKVEPRFVNPPVCPQSGTHVYGLVEHPLDVRGHQAPNQHTRFVEDPEKAHIVVAPFCFE